MTNSNTGRGRTAAVVLLSILLLAGAAASSLFADERIAQIDPSRLLTQQQVDVYVSVTGSEGQPVDGLTRGDFTMAEGVPGGSLLPVGNFTLHEGADPETGITFYLLVDNSGSMYEPLAPGTGTSGAEGSAGAGSAAATGPGSTSAAGSTPAAGSNAAPGSTPAAGTSGSVGQTRIAAAEAAIRTFLNSITNPADRTGLATFSTYYRPEVLPNRNRSDAETALDSIKRPAAEGAFTELYASLRSAAKDLAGWKGRKVIILLTDGENYPYKLHTGKPSPQFGNQVITSDQAIQSLIREGISVFPIHFGPAQEDSNLSRIARETGGRLFEASNESELAGVYLDVRSRVLKEYRLTYTPRMLTGDRRIVQVGYSGPGGPDSAKQTYFVGTLFGGVPGGLSPLLLIPLLLALAGWFLLSRLRFLNRRTQPNIELLGEGRTQVCAIAGDRTILRPAPNEAVTVVEGQGEGDAEPGDVTISKNRSTGAYTVVSSEPVMINNRPERRRDLSPGDVIRMGEVTVVFDDPEKE